MGLFKRIMGEESRTAKSDFVDLGDFNVQTTKEDPTSCFVKLAEVTRFEDVAELAEQVYGGHILLIDIKNLVKDEFQMRRVTTELKRVASDVGGDVAGIGEGIVAVTPRGIKVERQKIRITA